MVITVEGPDPARSVVMRGLSPEIPMEKTAVPSLLFLLSIYSSLYSLSDQSAAASAWCDHRMSTEPTLSRGIPIQTHRDSMLIEMELFV